MFEALIIVWFAVGLGTAILADREARWEGLSVPWGWWLLFIALGPIVPMLVLIIVLMGVERRREW